MGGLYMTTEFEFNKGFVPSELYLDTQDRTH